jgi:BirA family transcriptional regulator, biotin operon repressor / biotin---[acetyl-CoA-carboxylase] ligase
MADFINFIPSLPQAFPQLQVSQFHPSLDSTNLEAKRLAEVEGKSSALIVAESQTAGRGRMGRAWESPKGLGLYFSLLLHPRLKPAEATLMTLAAGWSLGVTLKKMGAAPIIVKWPNDIVLQGKKIAGVLCEMKSRGNEVEYVVVGIGINISQKPKDFSLEVAAHAGSLELLTGKIWDKEKILQNFLQAFFPEVKKLEEGKAADLIQQWEGISDLLGRKIRVRSGQKPLEGTVLGLNPQGHLRLKLGDGSIQNLIDEETTLL